MTSEPAPAWCFALIGLGAAVAVPYEPLASLGLLLLAALGLLPAWLAGRKGEPFWTWWLYGALLFVVAVPHAIWLEQVDAAGGLDVAPRT